MEFVEPEGRKSHGRPKYRSGDNIKMNLQEVVLTGFMWLRIGSSGILLNTVMKIRVP
jgi:hypothetical protein